MDENYLSEKFARENVEEKAQKNVSSSWISCKQNDGAT